MLQPRKHALFVLSAAFLLLVDSSKGQDYDIKHTPRLPRQNEKDVTTVLLVDNRGRSSFGRFLNVKPDLGLITSTARTFIQAGVTTEYATQVLGTTLDNGRLYAHLLAKSSRVLYDDSPSKSHERHNRKWSVNENNLIGEQFLKNIDFVSPTDSTISPTRLLVPDSIGGNTQYPRDVIEEEVLKESPSNNYRFSYEQNQKIRSGGDNNQNNIKVFRIGSQVPDYTEENVINHKELDEKPLQNDFLPSKVRPWDNLPTFTVRNEFSPSGLSFLGDFPESEERTERTKVTSPIDRKAKLLFKAGLARPSHKDLTSITYSGFADFTTTVGETVIIFTPNTKTEQETKQETTQVVQKPSIQATTTLQAPPLATRVKTFLSQEPPMETETFKGDKLEMQTLLPTLVIDKTDRTREAKSHSTEERIDMDAKSAVLAREQGKETDVTTSSIPFTSEIIQPSETQPSMLSTPSDEDIAKIFASLQALAKQSTEPLSSFTSVAESSMEPIKDTGLSGSTTIFFDEEVPNKTSFLDSTIPPTPPVTEEEPSAMTTTTEKREDEHEAEDQSTVCSSGSEFVPTTAYKTLTYLTTFYIPVEGGTTTSVKANEVVSTETVLATRSCQNITTTPETTTSVVIAVTEEITTIQVPSSEAATEPITEQQIEERETTTQELADTTTQDLTTEVTDPTTEQIETTTDDDDEIEVIFKTLFTTYTYLTTYFQETTSSIASRIVVTTNVITSTLDPGHEATDSIEGLFDTDDQVASFKTRTVSFEDLADITPRGTGISSTMALTPEEDSEDGDSQENVLSKPTPMLDDDSLAQTMNAVKTYYTTYTYFTTIFVDGETEISSRTEVYTNFVTPSVSQQVVATEVAGMDEDEDEEDDDDEDDGSASTVSEFSSKMQSNYNTINRQKYSETYSTRTYQLDNDITGPDTEYSTIERKNASKLNNDITENRNFNFSDYETIATMVTDVRSSTSEGDRRIIDNVDKRNVLLDDQVVSESNNDSEILPSPTLLLQTSYTTFTYFTTMYQGTTSSNVVSRLETITNVVTQTLTPTQTLSFEDLSLPITYFTTFTYWTTLYKDGTTKITSREETLSNIETPTVSSSTSAVMSLSSISSTPVTSEIVPTMSSESIVPSSVGDDDLTTFFTTYTYYTTSYVGDSSVLNSRLETVTNVLNNLPEINGNHIGRAIGSAHGNKLEDDVDEGKTKAPDATDIIKPTGLLSTIESTVENDGVTTVISTDVYGTYVDGKYAQVHESTSSILTKNISASSVTVDLQPTGVVSINKGKIVDAEGVSTLFYTTQAIGTYIDNLYAQVIESTSSLAVDDVKKLALPTDLPIAHRTGLVRLIEGSIVQNDSTTFYESKVLGTMIDGRYAQIIESTSSFLVGRASIAPSAVNSEIIPSSTLAPLGTISSIGSISPSPVVIEGSISETSRVEDESSTEENVEDDDKDNGSTKSRLSFQSRKRTFTPAIRPFASRQRPTFAPKRKAFGQSTAATITRSDFTPTVTAVLASKSNRFGGRRSSSSSIQPTASGSRRFSRPKSSSLPGYSSSFGGGRRSSSSRIQPTISGSGSRRVGLRSSSLFGSRPRIRPTASTGLARSPSSNIVTQLPPDEENDLTTIVTEEPTDASGDDAETTLTLQTTTEAAKRNQNPLLKFRRPLTRTPGTRNSPVGPNRTTARRVPTTTTTTTAKPKTTVYNRPSSLLSRPRPNALFPRRNLFTTTTPPPEEDLEDSEDLEEEEEPEEDTDYDSSLVVEKVVDTAGKVPRVNVPRPFFRRRSKRDTYSRFRRPSSTTTTASSVTEEEIDQPQKVTGRNRYVPKSRNAKSTTPATTPRTRITPSKTTGRTQFTLREKDKKTNFKRPTTARSNRPTTNPRLGSSRLRNNHQTEANSYRKPTTSRQSSRSNNRGRSAQRQRQQKDDSSENDNYVSPPSGGTITVTHQIPTEITIPVVNGKITEYKNVVTAKLSTEILGPRQYSTTVNPFGKEQKVLLSEHTGIANNGATVITQFVLNETPTTSVIFTPTYINRRKTSFSHVIPSTIYGVEQVVNTIQPALVAQAPLANILLSQLLLGGLQPQANPLLGLQQQQQQQAATPTTELKTRTTTYVTTVTSEISTVIPLTFRGKEILTTIIDTSVTVLTATEFLTDTIVVTPTFGFQAAPQLNTALLLQLQQFQQQQQSLASPQLLPQANAFSSGELPGAQPLFAEEEKFNFALEDAEELSDPEEATPKPKPKNSRRGKKNKPQAVQPPKETSVITLYVSGRIPGEFTTVLSTVTVDAEGGRRKRDIHDTPLKPSRMQESSDSSKTEEIDRLIMPTTDMAMEVPETYKETESLESIIGDVSKHLNTNTPEIFGSKPTKYKKATKPSQTKYVLVKKNSTGGHFFG